MTFHTQLFLQLKNLVYNKQKRYIELEGEVNPQLIFAMKLMREKQCNMSFEPVRHDNKMQIKYEKINHETNGLEFTNSISVFTMNDLRA